jgi:hypothetical protein
VRRFNYTISAGSRLDGRRVRSDAKNRELLAVLLVQPLGEKRPEEEEKKEA